MVNELPDDKAMLDLAKQARLAISYQAPFQQDSAFADWLTTSYKQGYRAGRSDCLQETLDLKKPLLPHELKLIAQFLDMASDEFGRHGCNDFELENTKRHRDMLVDMEFWNDKTLTEDSEEIKDQRSRKDATTMDYFVMSYMAHRVREALTEEEG